MEVTYKVASLWNNVNSMQLPMIRLVLHLAVVVDPLVSVECVMTRKLQIKHLNLRMGMPGEFIPDNK